MNRARNNQTTTPDGRLGDMNMNRMQGVTPGAPLTGGLADQIRALRFVKTELELYLDTHPHCNTALDYYYRTIAELKRLTDEYENNVGPITAAGVVSPDHWTWVREPWPWQRDGDYMQPREER